MSTCDETILGAMSGDVQIQDYYCCPSITRRATEPNGAWR
jgi:hypothetical protein